MTGEDYRETLDAIRTELEDVLNKESELERQLREARERSEGLEKAAQGLAGLVGEDQEEESIGITAAIREILKSDSERSWAPRIVRLHLKREEFPIGRYQNPLAVIHTTLRRLEGQGEVEAIKKNGKTFYKWIDSEGLISDDAIPF